MKRVLIIGCPGSGKTTLARALGEKTGLPVVHLDQRYWLPNWIEMDKAAWLRTVEALIAEPRWIIDGNYGGTLAMRIRAADTVVFLDFPRWRCFLRVLRRTFRSLGRARSELPLGCPERFDREFLTYVCQYPRKSRQRVLAALDHFRGHAVTLRTPRAVRAFLTRATAVTEDFANRHATETRAD